MRLKINIEDNTGGLDTILALHPITYTWYTENDTNTKSLGFLAQEVEEILPKLVRTDPDGYKQLNTISLIPVLTKAIQELNEKMETLSPAIAEGQVGYNWWINMTTGELTSNGMPINMQGANINNVNAIFSASGKWRIDQDGRLVVKSIETEELRIRNQELGKTGITIYDTVTGQPGCVQLVNGALQTESGECGYQNTNAIANSASETSIITTTPIVIPESTATTTTATSAIDTATTTNP